MSIQDKVLMRKIKKREKQKLKLVQKKEAEKKEGKMLLEKLVPTVLNILTFQAKNNWIQKQEKALNDFQTLKKDQQKVLLYE